MQGEAISHLAESIKSQAAKLSVEESVERLRAAANALHSAARAVEAFDAVPDSGERSVADCLVHVVQQSLRHGREILYVAFSGGLPPDQDDSLPTSCEALIATHDQALESLWAHVREADPGSFLSVRWSEPVVGALNWREWLVFLEVHCKEHTEQLRTLIDA